MSQIMFMVMMIMNSFLFSAMSHPMNMGITLLMQTLLMCAMTCLMSYSSWFSYILFLVFIGGMLVLFIYMTSIASNEMFKKSLYFLTIMSMMLMMVMLMIMMSDPMMTMMSINEDFMMDMYKYKTTMNSLYNNPASLVTIFMVLYLFFTLIIIVYITKYNKGPLRPMN
uniref:NADH-ubiquinone oxidoreductase chain 6 n=1 Tax=Hydrobasileus croceus TaxID=1168636 RepID=A0A0A0VAJ2_9ODON|nr:NADH dehydrogenase subunit 6 [Hydrobasileus croceus]AIW64837.1 NADH dehydrogenase subunit 6 [Hydrobasileus croceus]